MQDYLEYRFGTIVSLSARNHIFGVRIPYYVWLGCPKATGTSAARLAEVDAVVTESPFLAALDLQAQTLHRTAETFEKRSKAYEVRTENSNVYPAPTNVLCVIVRSYQYRVIPSLARQLVPEPPLANILR